MSEGSESELSNRSDDDICYVITSSAILQQRIKAGIESYKPNPWFFQDKKLGKKRKEALLKKLGKISEMTEENKQLIELITIMVSLFEPEVGLNKREDDKNIPLKADNLLTSIAQQLINKGIVISDTPRSSANQCPLSSNSIKYTSEAFTTDSIKQAFGNEALVKDKTKAIELYRRRTVTWLVEQAFAKLSPASQLEVRKEAESLRLSFNPNYQPSSTISP